ncbi:DUF2125 domain-containing protein [Roseovarius sp. 2305UL8-3]|uniref:DUF2125 domain-containing protein n=1 Tax=Roseovarius conchicola TaxID=3121636 RepID=UPI003528CC4D
MLSHVVFSSRRALLTGTTTAVALVAGLPALADVTAEDVWQNLRAPIMAMGGQIEAETTRKDNQLEVGENVITFQLPMDQGSVTMTSSGFTLAENGDGTVSLLYPGSMVFSMSATGPDGLLGSGTLTMDSASYTGMASGDPGDVSYDYGLDGAEIKLTELTLPEAPEFTFEMTGTMTGAEGTYRVTEGDIVTMALEGTGGDVQFDTAMTDDTGVSSKSSQTTSGGTTSITMAIPNGKVDIMNLSQALRDGLEMSIKAKDTRLDTTSETTIDGEGLIVQNYGYMMDDVDYVIDASGLVAAGTTSDVWFEFLMGQAFPVPIKGAADQMTGRIAMPLNKTEGPVDTDFAMSMDGFTMDDALWGMFDPAAQLPRDPARLSLDMTASVESFIDLLDIEALMALETSDETPAMLHGLTLKDLALEMVGASLKGQGAFTFDNTDYDTFDGIPAPDGAIDLELSGANQLLDTLVAMGLLPEEQAMGARMMMGLFAVPGVGEDVLTSKIEVKPDGQILANGQRLQ